MVISLENLGYLGAGFGLGVLVCLILARTGVLFFSSRIRQMSDQTLYQQPDPGPV